jgi:uncharacterized protein (DUF58 family)
MIVSGKYCDLDFLTRLRRVGLRALRRAHGDLAGLNRSPYLGQSAEFADHRPYVPGDDLRRLDWRVYGRTGHHVIRLCETENNLRATFVVDASASMRYGSGPRTKYDLAATAVTGLASLLCEQRDASALVIVDEERRAFLQHAATDRHLSALAELLEAETPARRTGIGRLLAQVASDTPRRALVVVASDFLTPAAELEDALARLRYRSHEIVLLHVLDKDELDLPFDGSIRFKDLEADGEVIADPHHFRKAYREAMRAFCDATMTLGRRYGADYALLRSDEALGATLGSWLRCRQKARARTSRRERRAP